MQKSVQYFLPNIHLIYDIKSSTYLQESLTTPSNRSQNYNFTCTILHVHTDQTRRLHYWKSLTVNPIFARCKSKEQNLYLSKFELQPNLGLGEI